MAKNELTRKYELVLVLDAKLSQDEKDGIAKEASDTIIKSAGKVINSIVWIEKHKIAFKIKKCAEAAYYLINFESAPAVASKVGQTLRLNEKILRFLVSVVE
jgi:ribosomal protein S6